MKMFKKKLILLLIILILPLISASDSELFIPCGFGDSELYVGCLGDEQGVSAFWGQDFIPPVITLELPGDGSQDTDGVVRFVFTPTEESTITICSLVYQDGIYITSTSISNGISNVIEVVGIGFGHPLFRDDLQWRIECTDEFGNVGTSETRHLDTKEDDVGDPGGGGGAGIIVLQNPKSIVLCYPEIWYRNSEEELKIGVYNLQDQLYEPPTIEINFTIIGVELNESKVDEFDIIVNIFNVSNDAELGNQTMEIRVIDERMINQTIKFRIDEERVSIKKEKIIKIPEISEMGRNIIIATLVLIFLFIVIILLVEDKRRKARKK